jgi:maltooligosyltrehalose synthase
MEKKTRKKGRPKGAKNFDREVVVNQCVKLRIEGFSTYKLLEFLSAEYNIGRPTGYEILQEAQRVVVDIQKNDIENAYHDAIARLERLYEQTDDNKLKLNIQQEINKIRGIYEPQKLDVTSGGETLAQIKLIQVNSKNDLLLG